MIALTRLSIALLAVSGAAQAAPVTDALDQTLQSLLDQTGTPGAAAIVTRNGQTVWSGAAGVANVGTGAAYTTDTVQSVASVTKLFVSTIFTKLAEQERVDLNAPIAQYVPSYVPATGQVTIGELINMTAGYPDIEALPAYINASRDPNHAWTPRELLTPITAPAFTPGTQSAYSNTNYLLLGQILDHIYPGGTSAAFRDLIVTPLGLADQVSLDRTPAFAARFAHGYETEPGVSFVDVDAGATDANLGINTSVWGPIWTDGGVASTATGLARFADGLYGGALLDASDTTAANATAAGNTIDGHDWTGFLGAFNGYVAFVLHDPARDVTIAGTANALDIVGDTSPQAAFVPTLIAAYDAAVGESPAEIPEPPHAWLSILPAILLAAGSRRGGSRVAPARTLT